MKKYVICKTGEPVNIGDILHTDKKISTSFGTILFTKDITVTESIIPSLVDNGIIKEVVSTKPSEKLPNIGYYISKLASKYGKSFEEIVEWLDKTNKICPKAVLDILLKEISTDLYSKNPTRPEEFFSLKLKDGKVGKVGKDCFYIPLFKSVEDAEKARIILKDQLTLMYGGVY